MKKLINNKKGEFEPRSWVIAFLIFSGVFALLFLSSNNLINDYDESDIIDENYRENYDQFTNVSEDYRSLFNDMSGEDPSVLEIIFGDAGIIRGFFDIVKLTFASVLTLDDVTASFVEDFGVPEGIANVIFPLISAILMVLMIFAIISAVNRGSKI